MAGKIQIFGLDNTVWLNADFLAAVDRAGGVVAGRHQYNSLKKCMMDRRIPPHVSVVPLLDCFSSMRSIVKEDDVVVLASGDPLFFGIGRRILDEFPEYEVSVVPAVSSMQLACARFTIPWDDAVFISLHGRNWDDFAVRVLSHHKTVLLTDSVNNPAAVAAKLSRECGTLITESITCHIGERLGMPEERLFSGTLHEVAESKFSDPNVMILLNPAYHSGRKESRPLFGLQEKEICHSRGLLTKNEVRAAAIHALRFTGEGVFWDVGAGSGSVGLEVSRMFPALTVLSIEKEKEQWKNIDSNIKKFKALNMTLIKGAAPDALYSLAAPDRVFVGGSGGNLRAILGYCAERLKSGGVIVVNAVIEKTAQLAPKVLSEMGFSIEIREVTVSRYRYPSVDRQQFNPITIIVASRALKEIVNEQ